jgi:hypothetical protein
VAFPVIHSPIVSRKVNYSLHHLQPQKIKLEGKGKEGRDLTVRVSYHSHVYSKADSEGAIEVRFSDEGGKTREFCTERHTWSLGLPKACRDMVINNYPSWPSEDGGGRNNMAVTEPAPSSGVRYLIFYEIFPSQADEIDLELVVKSAYEKDFDASRTGPRRKVHALLRESLFNERRVP